MDTRTLFTIGAFAALAACSRRPSTAPSPVTGNGEPPPIQREMRGLWVTTVGNTDWPTQKTLTAEQQKAELTDLFDRTVAAGFNVVIFHVRPSANAVYASEIEPWGEMLTGVQGKDPGYDPLAFAVKEAHARGLEIHAWINPFRGGNTRDTASFAKSNIFYTHRELERIYGTQVWLDPGEPAVRDHVISVVNDIVRRYDIDGIHADDYFYPYRQNDSSGKEIDFPDSGSFARSGTSLSRDDWRRANVDTFLERMYREVHAIKPLVKVGVSPFGIWRPGNPPTVAGLDAYQSIYADSRKWLVHGYVDYLSPQLYWAISSPQQSFPALLDWWLHENTLGRNLWPGLAAYRTNSGTATSFTLDEIPNQISLIRARPGATGNILFTANSVLKKSGGAVANALAPQYATPALVPAFPWLGSGVPPEPQLLGVSQGTVNFLPGTGLPTRWFVIRARLSTGWTTRILFGDQRALSLASQPDRVMLNAVDQAGNLSSTVTWQKQ